MTYSRSYIQAKNLSLTDCGSCILLLPVLRPGHVKMSYYALQVFVHVSSLRGTLRSGLGLLEEAHYMDVRSEG